MRLSRSKLIASGPVVVVEWGQEEVVPAVVEDLVARGKGWGSSRRKPEADA